MAKPRESLNMVMFINKNSIDDLASVSELCKDGWVIISIAHSSECTLPTHDTKVRFY